MRKFSLLIVLSFFFTTTLLAQEKSGKRIGFRAGVNYFTQRIELNRDYERGDYITGLTLGLFREIPINNNLTFQPELVYNRMGGKADSITTKLRYVSLPLLLKVHGKRFGAYVGPQFSLLMNAKEEKEMGSELDVKDKYKSADLAGVAGVEYSVGANNRFVFSARYQFSINDVWKDAGPGESIRNTGFQVTAGFRF